MSQSKEERKAYLCGKVDALEALEWHWSAGKGLNIEQRLAEAKRDLAALDIPQLEEHYGVDRVEIPAPWEWDETFAENVNARPFIGSDHEVYPEGLNPVDGPRLGLRKRKPTRVWFEAEESKRLPQKDDWFWGVGKWNQARYDFVVDPYLCAIRHEEFDESPQVITQADVDRVLGSGK